MAAGITHQAVTAASTNGRAEAETATLRLEGQSVYVVDASFRGWEDAPIEVGALAEDQPTYFWAMAVRLDT
jgi:hypothetical protein